MFHYYYLFIYFTVAIIIHFCVMTIISFGGMCGRNLRVVSTHFVSAVHVN